MRKYLALATTALLMTSYAPPSAFAQVELTAAEQKSLQLSGSWQSRSDIVRNGENGVVTFLYGVSQPTIVCAPLRLCDLQLQPNEEVIGVHVGDAVQWNFDGARSGPNGNTPHILIKLAVPRVTNLIETSLVVTTDLRVYHINLKSHPTRYMARMNFDYSSEPNHVVEALANSKPAPLPEAVASAPTTAYELAGTAVEELDFRYDISGKASWKPERIYNDGLKTIIEMPPQMRQSEAPALLVINESGNQSIVNYRVRRGRYIVDQVFQKAVLVAGVGRRQTRVTIEREADASVQFAER